MSLDTIDPFAMLTSGIAMILSQRAQCVCVCSKTHVGITQISIKLK